MRGVALAMAVSVAVGSAWGQPTEPAPAPAAAPTATPEAAPGPPPAAEQRDPLRADRPELDLPKADVPDYAREDVSLGWTLFRTVVLLGLVVSLIYLTLNVGLRRLLGIASVAGGAKLITVLERVPLDQKRALFVVRAGNEVLLIGGGDAGLALLSKLDAAEVERLRAPPPGGPEVSPFVARLLGKKGPPPAAS